MNHRTVQRLERDIASLEMAISNLNDSYLSHKSLMRKVTDPKVKRYHYEMKRSIRDEKIELKKELDVLNQVGDL